MRYFSFDPNEESESRARQIVAFDPHRLLDADYAAELAAAKHQARNEIIDRMAAEAAYWLQLDDQGCWDHRIFGSLADVCANAKMRSAGVGIRIVIWEGASRVPIMAYRNGHAC